MSQITRMMTGLTLAAMMAACSQAPPPAEPEVVQPAEDVLPPPAPETPAPMPAAPVSDAPSGSMVVYTCDDKTGLTVTYDQTTAMVKLPTGSTTLPRAEALSSNGDEAYLGEELSLYRNGDLVRLDNAGKSHTCSKTASSR